MAKQMVCTQCGTVGTPIKITKGSLGMEIVLWLMFLIPGAIYSVWRLTSRYEGCPSCKGPNLVPVDSPMGKKMTAAN